MKCKLFFLITAILVSNLAISQQLSPAQQLAQLQAQRMQDSTGINNAKKQKIYLVNMQIFYRKRRARYDYASQPELMVDKVRQFEDQRDSLYRFILKPEEKYQLYLEKKDNILSAN